MTNDASRWNRVKQLLGAALDRPLAERDRFLYEACGDDFDLRTEVDSLLRAHAEAGDFANRPAAEAFASFAAATTDGPMPFEQTLRAGDSLGVYEIADRLGAGGMGQVYRARDRALGRDVAVKALPPVFAADPERRAWLVREARLLAQLNHPHIAAIYGLEQSGKVPALVLELVEGPTLAERLTRGPLMLKEALSVAQQIAEALEAAHERGIIHRDLKPANIKFTRDGVIKVLDFGLAKAIAGDAPGPDLTQLRAETISRVGGVIMGTVGYMSPEQATGDPIDKRTDIWAFGCVLFEMVAGRRAFGDGDSGGLAASVVLREPSWDALPQQLPRSLRRLIQRCLERDARQRLGDIAAARFVLEELANVVEGFDARERPSAKAAVGGWRQPIWRWVAAASLAAMLVSAAIGMAVLRHTIPPPHESVTRTTIALTGARALTPTGVDRGFALSPDGMHFVYVGNSGTQLFVRAANALDPVVIATGTNLRSPFVSRDGQWVAFFERGALRKVRITGGTPATLAELNNAEGPRGAAWASDDTLIVATNSPTTGLLAIPADGGTPVILTRPDRSRGEAQHLWPEPLPAGGSVLFTITSQNGGLEAARIAVLDLRTRTQKTVLRGGTHAQYLASGHLVYAAARTLRAIAFDAARLDVRGADALVVPRLQIMPQGGADFAVSGAGTLVYLEALGGADPGMFRSLVWVDRSGHEEPIPTPPRAYMYPRISPDATRLALDIRDQDNDIWIWDFERTTLTRLTIDPSVDRAPEWTRDSRRIIFTSNRSGADNLWWQAADGTGGAEQLTMSANAQFCTGTTPDGAAAIFVERMPTRGQDLKQLSLNGSRRIAPLLETRFNQANGVVSRDGHWIAYESDSSGQTEIYVRPFPDTSAGQWQVSTGGGTRPLWAPNGGELFYVGSAPSNALMRVPVDPHGMTWRAGTPTRLLEGRYFASNPQRSYDISADGQRFVMIKPSGPDEAAQPSLVFVQHWDQELKQLVPPK
jgi:serine/threonine-protein kinase